MTATTDEPRSPLARIRIWASGYTREELEEFGTDAKDRTQLTTIGTAVLIAACWVAANCAMAAAVLSGGGGDTLPWYVCALVGLAGGAVILVFDRAIVYTMDTVRMTWLGKAGFLAVRLGFVLSIAVVIDTAMVPWVMRAETEQQGQRMREQAEAARAVRLAAQFSEPALVADNQARQAEVTSARAAAEQLPAEIRARLDEVRRCYAGLTRVDRSSAEYAARRRSCNAQSAAANRQATDYRTRKRAELTVAEAAASRAQDQLTAARGSIAERLERGDRVDAATLSYTNPMVFWALISSDLGALIKALAIFVLRLSIDLMPIIVKASFGRSGPGQRIAARRHRDEIAVALEMREREIDAEVSLAATEFSAEATRAALQTETTRRAMREQAEYEALVTAPMDSTVRVLEQIAAAERRASRIRGTSREFGRLKAGLMAKAMAEAIQASTTPSPIRT